MRLWTIHPSYLDARGLVALWRESLLAQKVLAGLTRGYRQHPQLIRFSGLAEPQAAIGSYLAAIWEESQRRGYSFDAGKIVAARLETRLDEHEGQLIYEWQHLLGKLALRDPPRHALHQSIAMPRPHPLFRIVSGAIRDWEKQ